MIEPNTLGSAAHAIGQVLVPPATSARPGPRPTPVPFVSEYEYDTGARRWGVHLRAPYETPIRTLRQARIGNSRAREAEREAPVLGRILGALLGFGAAIAAGHLDKRQRS